MTRLIRNLNGFFGGVLFIVVVAFMVGCSAAKPYAEFAVGYQLDEQSDWHVRAGRPHQCDDNVKFDGELGLEWPNNWGVAYHHQSWVLCGAPFGDGKPELYQDDIRVWKRFGGWR